MINHWPIQAFLILSVVKNSSLATSQLTSKSWVAWKVKFSITTPLNVSILKLDQTIGKSLFYLSFDSLKLKTFLSVVYIIHYNLMSFLISVNAGTNVIKTCPLAVQKPAEVIVLAQPQENHNLSVLFK